VNPDQKHRWVILVPLSEQISAGPNVREMSHLRLARR
jgi:hypothetical protein